MNLIRKISLTLLLLPGCAANLAAQNLPVEIEAVAVPSQLLGHDVNVSVVIPQGADSLRYPVAYMLHGIGGDNSSWLEYGDIARTMQRLVDSGEIAPMVIVMPDGYLSYYSDAADGSLPYESFFTTELMPWVESTLPVIIDKATGHTPAATTSIGGFSMGGFGALTLGLRHPDRFGAIAALSPSIRTDEQFTSEGPQEEFDKQWGRTFGAAGKGTFLPLEGTTPFLGEQGKLEVADEIRLETIVPAEKVNGVIKAMLAVHPYEEAAYDIYPVEQKGKKEGIGRMGELPKAVPFREFAEMLREKLQLDHIRLVGDGDKLVKRVGLCTGAGVDFVSLAAAKGCDAYLTGDIKYHEAQKAVELGIAVADVTHYASEVLIVPILQKKLTEAAQKNGWNIEVVCSQENGQTFWTI